MTGIELLGTGRSLPAHCVTNDDLARVVETSDEWVASRTGIRQRYFCTEEETAAQLAHCTVKRHWVSKSKPGLANHAMAELTYRNLELAGPPVFGPDAIAVAQRLQAELDLEPMASPFADELSRLIAPKEAEARIRREIPAWQTHYTSDDYTDMTWHAPAVRYYVGRATLKGAPGFAYPDWMMNALGGIPATIDPTGPSFSSS